MRTLTGTIELPLNLELGCNDRKKERLAISSLACLVYWGRHPCWRPIFFASLMLAIP
jgi:hypothetical protein